MMVDELRIGDMVLTGSNDSMIIGKRKTKRNFVVKAFVLRGKSTGLSEFTFLHDSIYYYGVHIRGGELVHGAQ